MSELKEKRELRIVSGVENPRLPDLIMDIMMKTWPTFILNDPVGSRYWVELYLRFAEFQLALVDPATDEVIAVANSIPAQLDRVPEQLGDRGWQWCIEKGIEDSDAQREPNAQLPLAITIPHKYQRTQVGAQMIRAMKSVGQGKKFKYFLGALRPSQKTHYPLIPFADYVAWKNEEGLPFDPWMRAHHRLGARPIRPCYRSLDIHGTVADWESWTGMRFPQSGNYVVPGALVPIQIDVEKDQGHYVEPNLWMQHPMD